MNQIKPQTITTKEVWEDYVSMHPEANFLTSWNWGVFHQQLGKQVYYRGYYRQDQLVGICLLVLEKAKRGNYLTCAGGPLVAWKDPATLQAWKKDLTQLAKQQKCSFVRVRPQILDTIENRKIFETLGFKVAPMHLTADLTLQLNLESTPTELLAQMRKSTRYEIKKSEKLGIKISISNDPDEINTFYQHQLELANKHGFVPFSFQFLHEQFKIFAQDNQVLLFHASLENKLLSTAFVIYYGQEAVYHYGISTPDNQKLPGAYAAQWAAINQARERGLKRYNFWGIAPKEATQHRFAGVSLFKRGFGGQEVAYLPAHDLPTSAAYGLIYAFEKIRAKRRHLE